MDTQNWNIKPDLKARGWGRGGGRGGWGRAEATWAGRGRAGGSGPSLSLAPCRKLSPWGWRGWCGCARTAAMRWTGWRSWPGSPPRCLEPAHRGQEGEGGGTSHRLHHMSGKRTVVYDYFGLGIKHEKIYSASDRRPGSCSEWGVLSGLVGWSNN